ncbi:hypothetical protein Mapa_017393 [Marchantia paleacea]|nr:hypothetical protein Mapa_017393 [Marchantia paleacea]
MQEDVVLIRLKNFICSHHHHRLRVCLSQMGMVAPALTLGSLKFLSSRAVVCNYQGAEAAEGSRPGNCALGGLSAGKIIEGPKSRSGVWGVDHGGRGRCWGTSVCCHAQPQQQQSAGEGEVEGVVDGMRKLLASEEKDLATQAARDLVSSLDQQGRVALLSAFYSCGSDEDPDAHFKEADVNLDGMLDAKEFATYAEAQAMKYGSSTKPLSTKQMVQLFTRAAIGMVGFGFTDNAIMIIAGDAIQNSIGATLGLTTLLSAGLGNAVADLIGTAFRGYIERWSGKMMPDAVPISAHQMEQKEAWWAETVGASSGVTVGCLLGLAPLFLLHNNNSHKNDDRPIDTGANNDAKFASISSYTTSSFLLPQVDAADVDRERLENTDPLTSLTTSIRPAHTPARQSFHSKVCGTPLLLSIVVVMALRRLVNYRKTFGPKTRNYCE